LNSTQMLQYSDLCQLRERERCVWTELELISCTFYVERQETTVDTDCSQQFQSTKMVNWYHSSYFKDELCDVVVLCCVVLCCCVM